ncbi:MAG TPA: T9SS type A sorting domain-containing protein [Bacteroidia bacterium]|nr:T9SS type A sorting domain-containing protein [Bacteroidia bacterium]
MKKNYSQTWKRVCLAISLVAGILPAQAQILFDNGPVVNRTGTGFGGADESVLYTTTFGMGTIGFGHQSNLFNRVADDFTSTDCAWRIDSIVFFSYQTGSSTTSTFTGVNFRVWDSIPDAVGSNVVYGDTTTNRMTRSVFAGAYRITETTTGNNTRPIMRNVCTTPGLLVTAGTFWIDWATTGSLASGPWANPRVPFNQAVTGNGRQRIGSVWNNALDGGTGTPAQGFPFIIYGTVITGPSASAGPDLSVCLSGTTLIGDSPTGTGGNGTLTYSWLPSATLTNATTGNPTAAPTANTTYIVTVEDTLGCIAMDSMMVSVNQPTTSSLSASACNAYVSPAGNTYTSSGTYMDTLTNSIGCDSIITINLTINSPTTAAVTQTVCDSYTAPSGAVYTASGTYMDTIPNMVGCDSVITIGLTVNSMTTALIAPTVCDSFTAPSGAVYTASGTYMDTVANMAGCDSVITIQLVVNTANVGVTMSGVQLTADAIGATYQWVNCDSGYAIVAGASSQSFFPTADGNYAVIVTENACTDTSACTLVLGTGVRGNDFASVVSVYPNPNAGVVTVDLGGDYTNILITITDVNGRVVYAAEAHHQNLLTIDTDMASGVYFLNIMADGNNAVKRLIRE